MIPIWQQYFDSAHSLLYVINAREAATLSHSLRELQQALAHPQMQVNLISQQVVVANAIAPGRLQMRIPAQARYCMHTCTEHIIP